MADLSASLAAWATTGYVIAPAGYGKTHLIAEATARSQGRQLILTHTYAGVNALRAKMRTLGVSSDLYRIDTIASWSLRLALSYRASSGWCEERPADNVRWNALYDACAHLLDQAFVRRIVRASYDGLYVDEYQDCSVAQHDIVLKLARDLPCRVLGDPLQGIFDFEGQSPIEWARDVEANFQCIGALDTPHRWVQAGAGELGEWLRKIRSQLEGEQPINLTADRPPTVRFTRADADPQTLARSQGNACRYFDCDPAHSVIAIHKGSQEFKAKCHRLSRSLSGRFSSIEEVEGKDLFAFIARIERSRTDSGRLKELVSLAKKCLTAVEQNLPAGTLRGEHVDIRSNTRNPEAAREANAYLALPVSSSMAGFLLALEQTQGVEVVRSDLFYRVLGVLRKQTLHPELSLSEAADKYHGEFRYRGRPVRRRKLIGTTLLVKGLEFDHAIVLDAVSLSAKELYVALTRGSRSLTIVSTNPMLTPERR